MNQQAYNELEDRTDTNGQNECRMARERFLLYTMKEGYRVEAFPSVDYQHIFMVLVYGIIKVEEKI